MNVLVLGGRLTADPELTSTSSGKSFLKFSVAVRRSETVTDFFRCKAWEGTADLIMKYYKKGNYILFEAQLQQEKWVAPDGGNREATVVNVTRLSFTDKATSSVPVTGVSEDTSTAAGSGPKTEPTKTESDLIDAALQVAD